MYKQLFSILDNMPRSLACCRMHTSVLRVGTALLCVFGTALFVLSDGLKKVRCLKRSLSITVTQYICMYSTFKLVYGGHLVYEVYVPGLLHCA